MAPPPYFDRTLLDNAGFEANFDMWTTEGSPTIVLLAHPWQDGVKAVSMTNAGDAIYQDFSLDLNQSYSLGLYMRFDSVAARDGDWQIELINNDTTATIWTWTTPFAIYPPSSLEFLAGLGAGTPEYPTLGGCQNYIGDDAPPPNTISARLRIAGPSSGLMNVDIISFYPLDVGDEGYIYELNFKPSLIFAAYALGPNPAPIKLRISGLVTSYDDETGEVAQCPCWWLFDNPNPRITLSMTSRINDSFDSCNNPTATDVTVSYNTQGLTPGEYYDELVFYGGYNDSYQIGVFLNVYDNSGGGNGGGPAPIPTETVDIPCLIVYSYNRSIAARYYVRLRDTTGTVTAFFDDWRSLEFSRLVNDIGTYKLIMNGDDERVDLFGIDCMIEVWRSVPGMNVPWYREFIGFHRGFVKSTSQDGDKEFTSYGVTLTDLLARTIIGYKAGTIYADKDDPADTVMKEYVEENCGAVATVANGRETEGVLPGFQVDTKYLIGDTWTGSRAFENLLDVLKEIARFARFDFDVINTGGTTFQFKTYPTQLGIDRTKETLDATTGLNQSGVVPVTFALGLGNVDEMTYEVDRSSETNVVYVLGKGEGATRTIITADRTTRNDSPWNRREAARPGSGQEYEYQMTDMANEELEKLKSSDRFDFMPKPSPLCLYGKHYFLGDRVTATYENVSVSKRIVGVSIKVNKDGEEIGIIFGDKSEH